MLRFWIKESVFSVVRLFISPFIRYELEFEEGTTEKILGEDQVFYALPENSISYLTKGIRQNLTTAKTLSLIQNLNIRCITII